MARHHLAEHHGHHHAHARVKAKAAAVRHPHVSAAQAAAAAGIPTAHLTVRARYRKGAAGRSAVLG
jgi:hypothetical protein